MGALTKQEIARQISGELGFSMRVSLQLVDEFFRQLKSSLRTGKNVKIVRFGTLKPVTRPSRRGINPITGKSAVIPAKRTVVFHPSRTLKRIVNAQEGEEILPDR
ncbi:MAG TPA: integration host factor subunit alpha [Thermodesulfobacteriaceae bacterium]|nr:integration host factor subunit alpha [Thermodesulfobacteriaceae bacterium]